MIVGHDTCTRATTGIDKVILGQVTDYNILPFTTNVK